MRELCPADKPMASEAAGEKLPFVPIREGLFSCALIGLN